MDSSTNLDKKIMEKIKIEFLAMANEKRKGFYISLERTYSWFDNIKFYNDYTTDADTRKHFLNRYLRNPKFILKEAKSEDDIENKHFIMRKTGRINYPWFSQKGFKMYCMIINEPKSFYVCSYFIQLEEDFLELFNKTIKEIRKERDELFKKFEKSDSIIVRVTDERDEYLTENNILKNKLKNLDEYERILRDNEDFASAGNPAYMELEYLQELHMKKAPLYIVNPEYVNKKGRAKRGKKSSKKGEVKKPLPFDMSSDSDNGESSKDLTNKFDNVSLYDESQAAEDEEPQEFSEFNNTLTYEQKFSEYNFVRDIAVERESGDESPLLYYYIGGLSERVEKAPENYHKIADIFVKDAKHLKAIKEVFDTDSKNGGKFVYKTAYKSIYQTTYTSIEDARVKISNIRLCDALTKRNELAANDAALKEVGK